MSCRINSEPSDIGEIDTKVRDTIYKTIKVGSLMKVKVVYNTVHPF